MNARTHPHSAQQPIDEGFSHQHMTGHNIATPYSSSAEGVSTDFNSSRATSYESPDHSWGMEHGPDRHVPGSHEWSPSMSHHPLPIHHRGSALNEGNAMHGTSFPSTRSRTTAGARSSPGTRKKASSPAASKVRKTKAAKPGKLGTVTMDAPLSVLTKDSITPLKDMETFVHRSTEARMKEKEKKNGYIVRPMNAFMLYRSAYAERAKKLFDQNNHQIVSKATGMSWKMESKETHEHYKMLSEIERENHQKAWPEYKFQPSKANNAARKRKGGDFSDDDNGTEQDPTDYEWKPSGGRKAETNRPTNRRYGPDQAFESSYGGSGVYPPQFGRFEYPYPPGRPMPMSMEGFPGTEMGYYPDHPHMYPPGQLQDPRYERVPYPFPGHMMQAPSGFPGANHDDLFEMGYMPGQPYAQQDFVDPKLEEFNQVPGNGMFTEDGFADYHGEMLQNAQHTDSGYTPLEDAAGSSILDMLSTDPEGFQKWVHNENQA